MRAPLTVGIDDGSTRRLLSRRVRGLRFRKTAPGGHADASLSLDVPRSTFGDLGPADRLEIFESDTGSTVWVGDTTAPGPRSGETGEGFDLSAIGGMGRASDRRERLIYLDSALDQWDPDWLSVSAPSANIGVGQFPEDAGTRAADPALFLQFNPGQPVTTGSRATIRYRGFGGSLMRVGGLAGFYDAGQTDPNFQLRFSSTGAGNNLAVIPQSVVGGFVVAYAGDTGLPSGREHVLFVLERIAGGATNVATDNVWGAFGEVQVLGHLRDRYGSLRNMRTTAHVTPGTGASVVKAHVLAHEVVEDLLGQVLTGCNPDLPVIEPSTHPIDQLAYHEPTTAAQVLDDLMGYESDFLWEIAGNVFRFRAWPTAPRYLLGSKVKVEVPGSDVDLCNRATILWTDTTGREQVTYRYADIPELGGNPDPALLTGSVFRGRVRDAEPVTLPEGRGSLANARRIGDEILAVKARPPRSARAVVTESIVDATTGRKVQPWQIEPGYVCRIQATGEDLRLTEMAYDDDSAATTLELGDPVRTVEQRVAGLAAA